jgi:diguanylate cyclase (GGDEF)-like protein
MEGSEIRRTDSFPSSKFTENTDSAGSGRMALLGCLAHDLRAATRRFEQLGFSVVASTTARDLIRDIENSDPSVVVVDADLSTRGYPRVHRTVLRVVAHRSIPVLVVCSPGDHVVDILQAGAADVVRRPASWELAARRAVSALESIRTIERVKQLELRLDEANSRVEFEEKRADRLSRVDQVTDLPNSKAFELLVERALAVRRRSGAYVAVLHLDLSRFNRVNETIGRRGGDEVLRQVAGRLELGLRQSEIVRSHGSGLVTAALARGNGTRFHAVLGNIRDPRAASTTAQEMLDSLLAPFEVDGREVYLGGSAGVAFAPSDGEDVDSLLRFADMASFDAQRGGPGTIRFFNASLNTSIERTMAIDRLLRRALERNELFLHYQPLVDTGCGGVIGAEALLRWRNPELGTVPPAEFIPIAENSGQIVEIGAWVLREALRQQRAWLDQGMHPVEMNINVSRCQLLSGSFADEVRTLLETFDIAPSMVVLELSERGAIANDHAILGQIQELKEHGVRLAVDDFGIGDSGIAQLRGLDFDVLKIDRSYISRLAESPEDATITSSMIAMAQRLRLDVVAEGVEDEVQLDWLEDWGCTVIQGFVFSPAVPPDEFAISASNRNRVSLFMHGDRTTAS